MPSPSALVNATRLLVLRELAARGSIAAVAEVLWLTPSAVSQQLAGLERDIGVRVIEKRGRGVKLTAAGRVLADHSERVLNALDDAELALRALQSEPSGHLRVASFPSVVRVVLPALLGVLRERHPDLVVEVEDLEGEQSLEALRLGRVDVAIVDDVGWGSGLRRDGLDLLELWTDRLVVVVPAGHRLAEAEEVPWSGLADEPMVAEQRSSLFASTVEAECRRAGFEPKVVARVHDAAAMMAFVENGHLIAVQPEMAVARMQLSIEWRPLVPAVHRRLFAATRAGGVEVAAVRALIGLLVSQGQGELKAQPKEI